MNCAISLGAGGAHDMRVEAAFLLDQPREKSAPEDCWPARPEPRVSHSSLASGRALWPIGRSASLVREPARLSGRPEQAPPPPPPLGLQRLGLRRLPALAALAAWAGGLRVRRRGSDEGDREGLLNSGDDVTLTHR